MDTNNNTFKYKIYAWVGILLTQMCLFWFIKNNDFLLLKFQKLYLFIQPKFQNIFSITSISIGDILYPIFMIIILIFIYKKYWRSLLLYINIIYFLFQIMWGNLYFTKPISEKLPKWNYQITDLKIKANYFLNECLKSNFHSKIDDEKLQIAIFNSIKFIPTEYRNHENPSNKCIKTSLYSNLLSYTGISGYYNPFTAEAQFDENLPIGIKTFSLAHELSHQLGFAREQEASFIGFLILTNSKNPTLIYWANWYNLKRVLIEIEQKDETFVKNLHQKFSNKMKMDWQEEQNFFKNHQSFLTKLFHTSNDWFLKLNHQQGSVSYSYYLDLMMRHQKTKESHK